MSNDVSMKKAVAYTAMAKYTTAILQLVFAAILSRLLTPEQFGTVAVINVFIVFFQIFCDMGFGTAVIQDKGLTERQTNHIFSWTVYLGFALMLLFIGASFPIAKIYEDSIYVPLGIILSVSLLFNSLNMIPNAVMLKQKQFKSIAFRTILSSIAASLFTIVLAFKGLGVYALVLQAVFTSLFIFLWNELSVKLKFCLKPEFSIIKRIWGYSVYQFLAQLLNYFNRNLDSLLIGKYFSKADLGQYNKSYHLMQLPITYIPGVIGPALHPILSEHQNDPQYIYDAYMRVLKMLSLVGCFITVLLYYTGEELVLILFGDQWHLAITPFKLLALSVWCQLLINTVGPIYQSLGNTKLMFTSGLIVGPMIIGFIVLGCVMGSIVSVATCVSIAYVFNFFFCFFILIKYGFHMSLRDFFCSFIPDLIIISILMTVTLIPLQIDNLVLSFIAKSLILSSVYIIMLIITKQHKPFLQMIKKYRTN